MRSGFLAILSLATLACDGGEPARGAAGQPQNLLLVMLDTTRADHLSCYGYERDTTPTIDALAGEGVRFEGAFAQSSLTPVSAGTLLSGAHPFRHGVRSLYVVGKQAMSADVASLFELLGASGRRTAGFVSAKPMGAQYGLARGFGEYHDDLTATKERYGIGRFGDAPQRPGDETTDLALGWLDTNGREPFALLVHMFDAHDPSFVPPREFLAEHLSFPWPAELGRVVPPGSFPALQRDMEKLIELYDAELRFMDTQFARLLAKLDALGVRDDTLVAVVADHGESFGEHDFYTHGLLYREQLHVPLILAGPGLPRGRVVDARVRLVDFLPTVAELFALPAPTQALDGSSVLAVLNGAAGEPREVYAEVHHAADDQKQRETEMYSLTVGDWKYVHRPTSGAHELYQLGADVGETNNLLLAEPEHEMAQVLRHRIQSLGAIDGVVPSTEGMTDEALERLRELGY
jgi:arylsulfatase A-like enzyme